MTRPQILPKQNLSPSGEKTAYFPSEKPKNGVFGGRVMTLPYRLIQPIRIF